MQKITEEILIQMNDIVCQGLGMLMERQEQHSHSHISTIRRVIARLLFEGEGKQLLNGTNDIYNEYVVAPFRDSELYVQTCIIVCNFKRRLIM